MIRCSVSGLCTSAHSKIPHGDLSCICHSFRTQSVDDKCPFVEVFPYELGSDNCGIHYQQQGWLLAEQNEVQTSFRANVGLRGPLPVDPRYQFPKPSPVFPHASHVLSTLSMRASTYHTTLPDLRLKTARQHLPLLHQRILHLLLDVLNMPFSNPIHTQDPSATFRVNALRLRRLRS